MTLNHSFALLLLAIVVWFFNSLNDYTKTKKMERDRVLNNFKDASEFVLGLYAVLYAVGFIGFAAIGFTPVILKDDTALVVALLYGGVYILFPHVKFFQRD